MGGPPACPDLTEQVGWRCICCAARRCGRRSLLACSVTFGGQQPAEEAQERHCVDREAVGLVSQAACQRVSGRGLAAILPVESPQSPACTWPRLSRDAIRTAAPTPTNTAPTTVTYLLPLGHRLNKKDSRHLP